MARREKKAKESAKRKAAEAERKAKRDAEIERKKEITLVVTAGGFCKSPAVSVNQCKQSHAAYTMGNLGPSICDI